MIKRIINKLGIYKTYPLEVAGKNYQVQVHKGLGFPHFWLAEPWMDEILKKLGHPDFRFLDVGVNIGQTLLKWKALFPDSTYVGFEPNLECVSYVNRLIENNKLTDCTVHPYGLATSAAKGKLFLLGKDKGDSSASTIENFRPNEERHAIPIETIPLKQIEKKDFDLVKIDVEGSELEVIQSLFEVTTTAVIICEILPVYTKENTDRLARQKAIQKLLEKHSYKIYRIHKNPTLKLEKLADFTIHGDVHLSDYIFVPTNKEASISTAFN